MTSPYFRARAGPRAEQRMILARAARAAGTPLPLLRARRARAGHSGPRVHPSRVRRADAANCESVSLSAHRRVLHDPMAGAAPFPGFGTDAIHAGQPADPRTGAVVVPISLATTFKQESPGVHHVRSLSVSLSVPLPLTHSISVCLSLFMSASRRHSLRGRASSTRAAEIQRASRTSSALPSSRTASTVRTSLARWVVTLTRFSEQRSPLLPAWRQRRRFVPC